MTVQKHYDKFLAKYYSWMFGDYEIKIQENIDFLKKHNVIPHLSKRAVDLGCGSGFQSMALADLGFSVISIDLSTLLLEELNIRREGRNIKTVYSDILDFPRYCTDCQAEVLTCMGDTLTHLDSPDKVVELFQKAHESLESGGFFCLTFRDMSGELKGLDRIIPVRSDDRTIITCFLEYESDHVNVNDIIYHKTESGWELTKSSYKKLRISGDWIKNRLEERGFKMAFNELEKGFVNIVAMK